VTVQKRLSQLGLAKQVGKGTAKTAPDYTVGLTGGNVYGAEIEESELDTTWSDRILQGHDRTAIMPASEADLVATPKMIGLLLLAVHGAMATTGSASPYAHTVTPATSLPWLTLFGSYGADKVAMADSKIDSIELSWEKTGALKVKFKSMGRTFTFDSAWVIGSTAERISAGVLSGVGGTFTVGGTSARVVSGSIKIENGLEAITASYSETPDELAEAEIKCSVSLTIVPDDFTLFREVVTGSTSGTTPSAFPVYGEVTTEFITDANNDLTFTSSRVKYATKMPDVDPAGGAAEIVLEGEVVDSTDGSAAWSFLLHNSVPTY
jgi:hypothetical protein